MTGSYKEFIPIRIQPIHLSAPSPPIRWLPHATTHAPLRRLDDEPGMDIRLELYAGQSQAAPRTPLESPCIARTTGVSTPSEKT